MIHSSPSSVHHTARTLWLTGLSASGKTTLANAVAQRLTDRGIVCKVLDGDELRNGLCAGLGYSREDRRENIRRAAEACRLLNSVGVVVIAALISPYREDRESARQIIGLSAFREIWIAAPLSVCEDRDPKGLYRKARSGEIRGFTGVDDPYEVPIDPYLALDTHRLGVVECVINLESIIYQE